NDNILSTNSLSPIYQRFSGQNFHKDLNFIDKIERSKSYPMEKMSNGSRCIFIPGNEMALMLKTSSDYVHSSNLDSYYGFKAEIIGYEFPKMKSFVNDIMMKNFDQDTMLYYIDHMIQMFECNVINLFCSIIDELMNCSPIEIMIENSDQAKQDKLMQKYSASDLKMAEKIFEENSNLLQKGFDLDPSLLVNKNITIENLYDNIQTNIHPFLDDFIELNIDTSGARLALWLQNEAFILPNSCLINIITNNNDNNEYCPKCYQLLIEMNPINIMKKLCHHCKYELFVKSISQSNNNNPVIKVGEKILFKIITRDQHEEIAYDPNACVEIQINFITFNSSSTTALFDRRENFQPKESSIAQIILQNPYQTIVKDKTRYHSITMMKMYENYSLEELRLEFPMELSKREKMIHDKNVSFLDKTTISTRSFDSGYYLACWTPTSIGSYRVELIVDGEKSENSIIINVDNCMDDSKSNAFKDNNVQQIKHLADISNGQNFSRLKNARNYPLKHLIRKFICSDSAGLRIRSLPSLQSEQIGIVSVNGLLTIIDQSENDDGIWVRLSNESIQAYSTSNTISICNAINNDSVGGGGQLLCNQLSNNNNDGNTIIISSISDNNNQQLADNIKSSSTFTLHDISIVIGSIPLNDIVYAVEIVQNEFGCWIRLSQDSLHSYINTLYRSSLFDNNFEGWILLQNINGMIYLQNIQRNYLNSTIMMTDDNCKDNPNQCHQYNNNKYVDTNQDLLPVKMAISNRSAQCIRAVFAAFIWHEGILNDFLTAASYLKFNANITKDFVQRSNQIDFNNQRQQSQKNVSKIRHTTTGNTKNINRRHQKIIFRHSVEVSQLLGLYRTSDENSNINFLENNNNIQNSTDDNENHHIDYNEIIINQNSLTVDDDVDQTETVPEILLNLLQIWEFVSVECLRQISSIRNRKDAIVVPKLTELKLLMNNDEDKYCEPSKQQSDLLITANTTRTQKQYECDKSTIDLNKNSQNDLKQNNVWPKSTTDNLYQSLMANVRFLLSLSPSNGDHSSMAMDKNSFTTEMLNRKLFDPFIVNDSDNFFPIHLLNNLGIRKSVYEQQIAEERLSDLATIFDDHQHLLSPDFFNYSNMTNNDELIHHQQTQLKMKKKRPVKFYRSISVGMNDQDKSCHFVEKTSNDNNDLSSTNLVTKKSIKSNETLYLDSKQKINMPFLCKPSTTLIDLIDKFQPKIENEQSQIMCSDVMKFIFSYKTIDAYNLLVKCSICSSAYRSLALNIINWLLINASNLHSIHDLLWIFVNSLLPKNDSEMVANNHDDDITNNDKDGKCKQKNKNVHQSLKSSYNHDVCRHPFNNLKMAGELANQLVTESLHRLMRSISNLLPLLPMGSPLQRMAIRCFGMEFTSVDHNFLHECKVFSHISAILTHSSMEMDNNFIHCHSDNSETKTDQDEYQTIVLITKELTQMFDLRTSSRPTMISSLNDNSTETFWESGNEDRNKIKFIQIQRNVN
ncbi:E3 ubiquitin-protein ligase-like protein, partial [Euroglyphus maynei]